MVDLAALDQYVPSWINHSNTVDQVRIFSATGHSAPTDGIMAPFLERPVTSAFQPATSTLAVPGSIPLTSEESKMVYHSMTGPQLMSWPLSHTMDPATARRLMTPLHVVTSLGNDRFPLYPQGASAAGGGLLKIATKVQHSVPAVGTSAAVKTPPTPAEVQQTKYATEHGHGHRVSLVQNLPGIAQRPACCPTLAVAPITSGDIGGIKRPASEEPALSVNWPQLKRRKLRTTFTKDQVGTMESSFQTSMYLAVTTRRHMAQQLGLEDTQVKTWFQNRRMRYKRQNPDEHITPARYPTSCRTRTQVVKPLHCPPADTQNRFVVPTPPPTVSTPSVSMSRDSCRSELPTYPVLPPSPVYNFGVAPSAALQENCCPAQAVYGAPAYPHFPSAGFGIHPWISSNAIGPLGGAQLPPRHI